MLDEARLGGGNAEGWEEAQATGEEREKLLGISQFTRHCYSPLVDEYDDPKWCHVDCCTALGIIAAILPWGGAATASYFATIGILAVVNPLSTAILASIGACFALAILALIATVAIIKKTFHC